MPKETKISQMEYDKRIAILMNVLGQGGGLSRKQMFQLVAKDWNISMRQFDNYLRDAKNEFKEDDSKEFEIARAKKRLEKLYHENLKIEDFKECRAIIESESRLFGWSEPESINHSITTDFDITKLYNGDKGEVENSGK